MFLFDEAVIDISRNVPVEQLWKFLPIGYVTTILIETPFLFFGLPKLLTNRQKLFCGAWLTACTYPVVVLVLPALMVDFSKTAYIVVAEVFAPVAECIIFWLTFRGSLTFSSTDLIRAFTAIIVANLASFGLGEVLHHFRWFGLI